MLQFETLNSTYQIDQNLKRVRRLKGVDLPLPRQGEDGVWQKYRDITPVTLGKSVVIVWDYEHVQDDLRVAKTTVTSPITRIISLN